MGCARDDRGIWWQGDGIESCSLCVCPADYLCDFALGAGRTCDALLCERHAIDQERAAARLDFCPAHDALGGDLSRPTWRERRDADLIAGIKRRAGRRFATFLVTDYHDRMDPDRYLPNGMLGCSGLCLTDRGTVFSFGFGWDAARQRADVVDWEQVSPEGQPWARHPAYRDARRRVGIGLIVLPRRRTRRARRFVRGA